MILPDEIGYLGYSEFFAGHTVDAAGSYHFGYSLFLAPLFWGLSSTEAIWNGLTIINGAFFGAALAVCFHMSRAMFPSRHFAVSALTTALCALYPAWISVSGYALYQGCFVFFFTLNAYLLIKSPKSTACTIGAAATAAFLIWIHSLGIVCCAMTLLVIAGSSRNARLSLSATAVTILLVGAYQFWLSPAVKAAMTPDGYPPFDHYPSMARALDILSFSGLLELFTRSLGQVTYILIATLGLAVTPLLIALGAAFAMLRGRSGQTPAQIVSLFAVGSIAGMTLFSASLFIVMGDAIRQDHWMYGRYNEGAVLPILLVGLSIAPSRIFSILAFLVPAVFAVLVGILAPQAPPISVLNSAGFWPDAAFPGLGFSSQILIGGISAGLVTATASSSFAAAALILAFAICLPRQFAWHDMATDIQREPQAVKLIKDQTSPGACIGLDPRLGFTRLTFLAFYLFDYRYSRVDPAQWSTKCDGPFLSLGTGPADADWVAAGDWDTRLYGKGAIPQDHYSNIAFTDASACAKTWCYIADGEMLSQRSQNGQMMDGALTASGPAGYLFFGPYIDLGKGRYLLRLSGAGHGDALLDVTTNAGQNTVAKFPIETLSPAGTEYAFDLPSDVTGLEIRLRIPEGVQMGVTGYVLNRQPN
ncbi:hypothetical protein EB231_26265 [Mesorhizobium sp. NZP2298]|nr:hypothetical protein EB231_26265 [Mesorhizobium sp. NZP2298]